METMDWTRCAADIEIAEDGYIDLKQFTVGQVIEHIESGQAWLIIDVRTEWLKVKPLFDCYKGGPRKHVRFKRFEVDQAFERGWWRIRRDQ